MPGITRYDRAPYISRKMSVLPDIDMGSFARLAALKKADEGAGMKALSDMQDMFTDMQGATEIGITAAGAKFSLKDRDVINKTFEGYKSELWEDIFQKKNKSDFSSSTLIPDIIRLRGKFLQDKTTGDLSVALKNITDISEFEKRQAGEKIKPEEYYRLKNIAEYMEKRVGSTTGIVPIGTPPAFGAEMNIENTIMQRVKALDPSDIGKLDFWIDYTTGQPLLRTKQKKGVTQPSIINLMNSIMGGQEFSNKNVIDLNKLLDSDIGATIYGDSQAKAYFGFKKERDELFSRSGYLTPEETEKMNELSQKMKNIWENPGENYEFRENVTSKINNLLNFAKSYANELSQQGVSGVGEGVGARKEKPQKAFSPAPTAVPGGRTPDESTISNAYEGKYLPATRVDLAKRAMANKSSLEETVAMYRDGKVSAHDVILAATEKMISDELFAGSDIKEEGFPEWISYQETLEEYNKGLTQYADHFESEIAARGEQFDREGFIKNLRKKLDLEADKGDILFNSPNFDDKRSGFYILTEEAKKFNVSPWTDKEKMRPIVSGASLSLRMLQKSKLADQKRDEEAFQGYLGKKVDNIIDYWSLPAGPMSAGQIEWIDEGMIVTGREDISKVLRPKMGREKMYSIKEDGTLKESTDDISATNFAGWTRVPFGRMGFGYVMTGEDVNKKETKYIVFPKIQQTENEPNYGGMIQMKIFDILTHFKNNAERVREHYMQFPETVESAIQEDRKIKSWDKMMTLINPANEKIISNLSLLDMITDPEPIKSVEMGRDVGIWVPYQPSGSPFFEPRKIRVIKTNTGKKIPGEEGKRTYMWQIDFGQRDEKGSPVFTTTYSFIDVLNEIFYNEGKIPEKSVIKTQ